MTRTKKNTGISLNLSLEEGNLKYIKYYSLTDHARTELASALCLEISDIINLNSARTIDDILSSYSNEEVACKAPRAGLAHEKRFPLLHTRSNPSPAAPAGGTQGRPVKPITHPSDSPVQARRHAADLQITHCLQKKKKAGENFLGGWVVV